MIHYMGEVDTWMREHVRSQQRISPCVAHVRHVPVCNVGAPVPGEIGDKWVIGVGRHCSGDCQR